MEELNDDELALLGAPWAKEGLLQRKIQVEAHGRKPQKKDWKQYFVVIQKGDLSMFVFGSGGGSSMGGGTVGGGNWMSSANRHGDYSLMHAMAMALPKPGYSASRPYCFTVTFPSGEISVFQAGTEDLVLEWVATCNYWAARKSRQPLVGGVSNMEYGWTRALNQLDENGQPQESLREHREPSRMGLGARARLGAISRVRGASSSGNDRVQMDKIHINEWKPPPHATMSSTLDEESQLESLCAYVQSLKEELDQHKTIEEPMGRLVSFRVVESS
jgi:PH/SEC7 domain-containing protein